MISFRICRADLAAKHVCRFHADSSRSTREQRRVRRLISRRDALRTDGTGRMATRNSSVYKRERRVKCEVSEAHRRMYGAETRDLRLLTDADVYIAVNDVIER